MKRIVAIAVVALSVPFTHSAQCSEGQWNNNGGGAWQNASNWLGIVPDSAGDVARFFDSRPRMNAQIDLSAPVAIGGLISTNPFQISIETADPLANTLTFDTGADVPATITVSRDSGRVRFNTSVFLSGGGLIVDASNPGSRVQFDRGIIGQGNIVNQGEGTLELNGDNSVWNGALFVTDGTVEVNHSLGLGSLDGGTFVNGGVLRIQQPIQEDLELNSGRIVAANSLGGDLTMRGGELTFAHSSSNTGNIVSRGGHITVDAVPSTIVGGRVNLDGGVTEIAMPYQRTLNLGGGGSGQGDMVISGRGLTNVNDVGVHYDGELRVSGRIAFNTPSSVRSLYVDGEYQGSGNVAGAGALFVSDSIVLHRGAIEFDSVAPGLTSSVPIEKVGFTGARLRPGQAYTGDVFVNEGSVGMTGAGFTTGAGVTIVRERHAEIVMNAGDLDETILLENSTGFGYHGGIRFVGLQGAGRIDLGHQGSIIGFGSGSNYSVRFEGQFSGGALHLLGGGRLEMMTDDHTYTGSTTVGGGFFGEPTLLDLRGAGGLHTTSQIILNSRSELRASNGENFGDLVSDDRIGDKIPIALRGGDLHLIGRQGVAIQEDIGEVFAERGESWLGVLPNTPNTVLALQSLTREGRATVNFRGVLNLDPQGVAPAVLIADAPTLTNGIIGAWATADLSDFASYSATAGVYALQNTVVRPARIADGVADSHVLLHQPETLGGNATVSTLSGGYADVDLNGHTLVLNQGGAMFLASTNHHGIKNGVLTSGIDELIVYSQINRPGEDVLITADVVDGSSGPLSFTKAGDAVLTLAGHNTYSGRTTINEGLLRIAQRSALPTGGDLVLDGGGLQLSYAATDEGDDIVVNEYRLRGGWVQGRAQAIRASSYHLEGGEQGVPFAGNGSVTKTTRGHVHMEVDNPRFSGSFEIVEGVVVARVLGEPSDALLQPFGVGPVIVQPDGILANRSFSQVTGNYALDANIVLNGGEIANGSVDSIRPMILTGAIDVTANSGISLYDADKGILLEGVLMQVESGVTVRDGVTLRTTGPGEFRFDGVLRVGQNSVIEAVDNLTRIRGVVTSNHAQALLELSGAEQISLENSVHTRAGESLTIAVDDEMVPLSIASPERFARGGGLLINPLEITAGGRLRPGDEVGALTAAADVTWGGGGVYEWEINDAAGIAGSAEGWDLLRASDSLNVTATADLPFTIKLLPVASSSSPLNGFDPFTSFEWVVADASNLNASLDDMYVDDSAFRDAFGDFPLGQFQLELSGNQLSIAYLAATCLVGETVPCDGFVDLVDLNAVRNHFGAEGPLGISGDTYPFDGRVDLADLNSVRNNFGAFATPVPEPPTGALLFVLLLAVGAAARARRKACGT